MYKTPDQQNATKKLPNQGLPGMLNIYTDGSSLKNGGAHARAGVGVYFGPEDERFVIFPLSSLVSCSGVLTHHPLS